MKRLEFCPKCGKCKSDHHDCPDRTMIMLDNGVIGYLSGFQNHSDKFLYVHFDHGTPKIIPRDRISVIFG